MNTKLPLWLLIPLLGFPQFSETVYSPALPAIAHALHTTSANAQWTLSIYCMGFAVGIFTWGRLSDYTGRRPAMLSGLTVYTIGSLLCMCSHSIEQLLVARFIQGIGASTGSVMTQTIARESMEDRKRQAFYSVGGFAMAFSITVGPFIGGYLIEWFRWESNFVLLTLIGLSLLFATFTKLPETKPHRDDKLPSIVAVFKQMATDKQVLGSTLLMGIANGILFSYYAEGPFTFINNIGLSPSEFGKLGMCIAFAALCGSLSARFLVKRLWSREKILYFGCRIQLISSGLMALIGISGVINASHPVLSSILILLPMMGLVLASFGFILPHTLNAALLNYKSVVGTAGALFGLSNYILISSVTWIMGYLNNGTTIPMPCYFLALSVLSAITGHYFIIKPSQEVAARLA